MKRTGLPPKLDHTLRDKNGQAKFELGYYVFQATTYTIYLDGASCKLVIAAIASSRILLALKFKAS